MIHVGIDTSGDNLEKGYYVVALAYSQDIFSVVYEGRKVLGKRDFTFHAYRDSDKVREVFINIIYSHSVPSVVLVTKAEVRSRTDITLVVKELLKLSHLSDSFVYYDNDVFRKTKLGKKGFKVTLGESLSIPVQVADYFSHYWWEFFNNKKLGVGFEKILKLTKLFYYSDKLLEL
ncbi:hypothetical protein [Stygiolobus caldivivus]|uniref:Uncharacterized protein n=1 Tax=Stygiolobus caldivivus TaxID=2824673 RepID=A0A8D5ZIV8_9CREN|nr:hypothetical protein [Stygiolobus caldivivus]BCU69735.1 hypothetical protein KN1_10320 [Stygiolobus caldivivus]